MRIEWEGHSITSPDGLYHDIWETSSGRKTIQSPVCWIVKEFCDSNHHDFIDEDTTVLAKMTVTEKDLEAATRNALVKEPQYMRMLRLISRGRFEEPEDN
jgi:hypothetical protein